MRALAAALCVVLGCAPTIAPAYLDALAAGDRALRAGRREEAVTAYDRAAHEAGRPRDRDEADYRAARVLDSLGHHDAALERLDRVAASSTAFERGARATYDAALVRCREPAAPTCAQGREALDALVRTRPETGPARLAVTWLLRDIVDDAAALAHIDAWLVVPAVRESALLETLIAAKAARLEGAGRTAEAIAAWRQLFAVRPYPQNSRWDDGHMALARMLRRGGDSRAALAALDEMLAVRDPACSGGSCDAPQFQEGAMLRGELLRDDVGDLPAAARAFRRTYEMFASSRVRDDALREEALVRERIADGSACEVWERLGREFPCTRHGREGRVHANACGRAVAPPGRDDCE